jgi:hypothetical protein
MRRRRGKRSSPALLLALCALALCLACGGEAEEKARAQAPAKPAPPSVPAAKAAAPNRPPRIDLLSLEPAQPRAGDRVRAVVRASDPDGDPLRLGYLWRVNGATVPAANDEIALEGARKGDRIELRVTASDGRAESEPRELVQELVNSAPQLSALELDPREHVSAGASVTVQPVVSDADGDKLELDYRWVVNGRSVAQRGPTLSTEGMRRGDRIAAFVSASDGDERSGVLEAGPIRLENARPVVDTQPEASQEGGVFRYQVEASDPDGDRALRYALVEAPEGMTIDPLEGTIEWRPSPEQGGRHPVTVEVDDRQGGVTRQSFEVTIDVQEPAPASPDAEPSP